MLREALIKVISEQITDSKDLQCYLIISGNSRSRMVSKMDQSSNSVLLQTLQTLRPRRPYCCAVNAAAGALLQAL